MNIILIFCSQLSTLHKTFSSLFTIMLYIIWHITQNISHFHYSFTLRNNLLTMLTIYQGINQPFYINIIKYYISQINNNITFSTKKVQLYSRTFQNQSYFFKVKNSLGILRITLPSFCVGNSFSNLFCSTDKILFFHHL